MASPPTPIPVAPDVPTSTDPEATFDAMFEAFLAWLKDQAQPGMNALGANVFSNAQEATAGATVATAQSQAAIAAVNSPKWVTGTNYAVGVAAWSPITGRTYRTKVALNPSATDPALDPTNWWDIASLNGRPAATIAAGGNAVDGFYHLLTGAGTLVLPTANLVEQVSAIEFLDISSSKLVYIDPGANKIRGRTGIMRLNINYAAGTLRWSGATYGWV